MVFLQEWNPLWIISREQRGLIGLLDQSHTSRLPVSLTTTHLPPRWAFNLFITTCVSPFPPSDTLGLGVATRLWLIARYSSKGTRRSACKLSDLRNRMYGYAICRTIKPRLGGFEEVEGCSAGAEGGIGRGVEGKDGWTGDRTWDFPCS